jgi:hypothetical protein
MFKARPLRRRDLELPEDLDEIDELASGEVEGGEVTRKKRRLPLRFQSAGQGIMRARGRFHRYTVRKLSQGAWELDVARARQRVYGRSFPTYQEACGAATRYEAGELRAESWGEPRWKPPKARRRRRPPFP